MIDAVDNLQILHRETVRFLRLSLIRLYLRKGLRLNNISRAYYLRSKPPFLWMAPWK